MGLGTRYDPGEDGIRVFLCVQDLRRVDQACRKDSHGRRSHPNHSMVLLREDGICSHDLTDGSGGVPADLLVFEQAKEAIDERHHMSVVADQEPLRDLQTRHRCQTLERMKFLCETGACTQTHARMARRRASAPPLFVTISDGQKDSSLEERKGARSGLSISYATDHMRRPDSPASRLLTTAAMMCQALSLAIELSE